MGLLLLVTALVYAPVLGHEYQNFDDPEYVARNPPVLTGLTPSSIDWAFTTGHSYNWHPITWLSHMLDSELFGAAPGPRLGVNVLIHLTTTLLLYAALRRATARALPSALVAGLFALHPLHVESVAWVSQRKDQLAGLSFALALLAYVGWAQARRPWQLAGVSAALALGLMAKPVLVTLPGVLLLLDYWPLRRTQREPLARLVAEKLPLLALCAISSGITFLVQRSGGAVIGVSAIPVDERVGNAVLSYVRYLAKAVWPRGLAPYYPHPGPWLDSPTGILAVLGCALLLAVLSVVAVRQRRRRPYLLVGWLWYLGMLLPMIGLLQVGFQAMADRYSYLPLLGIFVAAAWGAADLVGERILSRRAAWSGAVAALASCALLSAAQVRLWRDPVTLWEHTVRVTAANPLARVQLGTAYAARGRREDARREYGEALRLRPGYTTAEINLAASLLKLGEPGQAADHYRAVLVRRPDSVDAALGLANALGQLGDLDEAIEIYRRSLPARPDDLTGHHNLALALLARGRPAQAVPHLARAVELAPESPDVRAELATALLRAGEPRRAVAELARASRQAPERGDLRFNLAVLLAGTGRPGEAERELQALLARHPDDADARALLASLEGRVAPPQSGP